MTEDQPISFSERPRAINLPEDSGTATAAVLGFVKGNEVFLPKAELEALRQRVESLRDPVASNSLDELARQLPVLEALWLRFSAEAVQAVSPDTRAKYLRMALQAQQAYARTFTLLRGLALQQQDKAVVSLNGDGSGSGGDGV